MVNENVFYFDGNSARPTQVRALLFNGHVHIHTSSDDQFIQSFPLAGCVHNQVGNTHYLYLDAKGLEYLQFTAEYSMADSIEKEVAGANPSLFMRLQRQKTIVLLPLVLVLGVGLYFLLVSFVPFLGSRIIGIQQEIKMGEELKEIMLREEFVVGSSIDTAGTRQLQAFADQLQLSNQYPIRLTLLKSKTVNAYALPGGQIVVYTGILKKIKTPEALAALLAHESTHVNERHSLRSMLRSAAHGILISVLFSDASGISGALASNAENLNGLRYSRSLETEADEKGMELLLANGVNLDGMPQLMKALQKKGDIPGILSFLSTHPLTKERIKKANYFIKTHHQKTKQRQDLQTIFNKLTDSNDE